MFQVFCGFFIVLSVLFFFFILFLLVDNIKFYSLKTNKNETKAKVRIIFPQFWQRYTFYKVDKKWYSSNGIRDVDYGVDISRRLDRIHKEEDEKMVRAELKQKIREMYRKS